MSFRAYEPCTTARRTTKSSTKMHRQRPTTWHTLARTLHISPTRTHTHTSRKQHQIMLSMWRDTVRDDLTATCTSQFYSPDRRPRHGTPRRPQEPPPRTESDDVKSTEFRQKSSQKSKSLNFHKQKLKHVTQNKPCCSFAPLRAWRRPSGDSDHVPWQRAGCAYELVRVRNTYPVRFQLQEATSR